MDSRTAAVAAATMLLLIGAKRWAPRSFPGALVAVAFGIVVSALLELEGSGVAVVGSIPSGLPGVELPDPDLVETLLPAAVGIAQMSFVESIAAARAFVRSGERDVDADRSSSRWALPTSALDCSRA